MSRRYRTIRNGTRNRASSEPLSGKVRTVQLTLTQELWLQRRIKDTGVGASEQIRAALDVVMALEPTESVLVNRAVDRYLEDKLR